MNRPGPSPRVPQGAFFDAPPPPPRAPFLVRTARNPARLGLVMTGVGFWAVFVSPANILHQIVLGAPIFEELFKVGLALLLVTGLRVAPTFARFLLALVPGAGFGVLEHYVSYGDEPQEILWLRVAFHGGSTGLSMAIYSALATLADVRARWVVTLPSTVLHYANNVLAVILGVAGLAGAETEPLAMSIGEAVAAVTWLAAFTALAAPDAIRSLARRRFPDPPPAAPAVFRPLGP